MISVPLKALLDTIRKHEAPKGYGQIYGGAKGVPKNTDVSKLSLQGVMDLQQRMLKAGSASTACGGYQFICKTFNATVAEMGLFKETIWTPDVQDEMAVHLMLKRGLNRYLAGEISRNDFANNLAKEWASLPVVTAIKGASRMLVPGQSYYAGDGLNKAFHKPVVILALVEALNPSQMPVDAPYVGLAPMAPRVAPAPPQPTAVPAMTEDELITSVLDWAQDPNDELTNEQFFKLGELVRLGAAVKRTPVNVFPAPEPPRRTWWEWLFGRA